MKNVLIILVLYSISLYAQQRKVLVEVFSNSHCTVCPPAHASLKNYNETSPNSENVNYIFYHMVYPYPDDPLYQANTTDPAGRNNYYGPYSSTPVIFFDGVDQGRTYNEFASRLDARVAAASPLTISLTGSKEGNSLNINAEVNAAGSIPASGVVIHFVVVENVSYGGRNGVAPQHFVMRKMINQAAGEGFSISAGQTVTVTKSLEISNEWMPDSINIVVFIQNSGTKEVYQSEIISYTQLGTPTGIEEIHPAPDNFVLYQNYPNPFNPVTSIQYTIPKGHADNRQFITLKVYDVLGNEVIILVNEEKEPGSYQVTFDGSSLVSGVYYYTLTSGGFSETKIMMILK